MEKSSKLFYSFEICPNKTKMAKEGKGERQEENGRFLIPIRIHHRAERAERNRCFSSSQSSARLVTRNGVDFAWRSPGNGRCGTLARRSGKRQAENSFFLSFLSLLLPPPPPPFFPFFFGISRSFASSRKCARVELEARVSWRARIGIYLLPVRYVVRLVNSISILDRVPKNFPRGPSNPQ